MGTLRNARAIWEVGKHLDIPDNERSLDAVLEKVREEVVDAIDESEYAQIRDLSQLKRVVCDHWNIEFERVEADDDIEDLASRYAHVTDSLETKLRKKLDSQGKHGLIYENRSHHERGRRWLAVVDARGSKRFSSKFTEWHEFAHVITGYFGDESDESDESEEGGGRDDELMVSLQAGEPKNAGESLVDRVASELMYWKGLWEPDFGEKLRSRRGLTFEIIEELRRKYEPEASFHSCAIHCVKSFHLPCLLVRMHKAPKAAEWRKWLKDKDQTTLLPGLDQPEPPEGDLRLLECVRSRSLDYVDPLEIWQNMRVPEESVLRDVYEADRPIRRDEKLNQSRWETSRDGPLADLPIYVEAKSFGPRSLGLIQPNWNEVKPENSRETRRLDF